MALTDTAIRNARPGTKERRLSDGDGLYLQISAGGSKLWRFRYRYQGREKMLSLGNWPTVTLRQAREKRIDARRLLDRGIDPSAERQATRGGSEANTFAAVAREWLLKQRTVWTPGHAITVERRLERYLFPWLGRRQIRDILAPDILTQLRRIEGKNHIETAHRVKQVCGQVFRYGIATGRCERNPAADLQGALTPTAINHHAAITDPGRIGQLLLDIDTRFAGSFVVQCALKLSPLVFVRPGELRHAQWSEIDLNALEWRIPAIRMKIKKVHIVPLSRQAVVILRELYPATESADYIFPSIRTRARPMSNNTINAALRRLGYGKDEMTGHGFRSMASTILNEKGWHPDAIERQLAHTEKNSVRAAYNYAEHLPLRRDMMQAWADYLDELKQRVTQAYGGGS